MSMYSKWLESITDKDGKLITKRVERFLVFMFAGIMTIIYLLFSIHSCSLSATDFVFILGTWLSYAGFNTIQGRKDKEITNKPTE